MRERDVENYLVRQVNQAGGEVRKVRWIGRVGAPDRLVLIPNHGVIWVELKSPTGRLSSAQDREIWRLDQCRQKVIVIRSKEGVDQMIEDWF